MDIARAGTRPSESANPDYFTGRVRMDPVASAPEPGRLRAVLVTFEPGARTNWHNHPLGQTLMVMTGLCLVQSEGGRVRELRPGDTVRFEPGEKHWHGAAPDVAMSHLAMQEALEGSTADWMEPVSDVDYGGPREG